MDFNEIKQQGSWKEIANSLNYNFNLLGSVIDDLIENGGGGGGGGVSLPATSTTIGGIKIGYVENEKNYPVELDSDSKAFVNVPWEELKIASSQTLGGIKVGEGLEIEKDGTLNCTIDPGSGVVSWDNIIGKPGEATTSKDGLMSSEDKTKLEGIQEGADSVSFSRSLSSGTNIGTITINGIETDIYAPTSGESITYDKATEDTLGLVKIGYRDNDKNIGVKLNGSGQMYVTVPDDSTSIDFQVDDNLSTISENPVQNKVITTELNKKSDKGHTHNASEIQGLAEVATSGSYNDLTDTPDNKLLTDSQKQILDEIYEPSLYSGVLCNISTYGNYTDKLVINFSRQNYKDSVCEVWKQLELPAATISSAGVMSGDDKKLFEKYKTMWADQYGGPFGDSYMPVLGISASQSLGSLKLNISKNNYSTAQGVSSSVTIPRATSSNDGAMSSTDKAKLDGIGAIDVSQINGLS